MRTLFCLRTSKWEKYKLTKPKSIACTANHITKAHVYGHWTAESQTSKFFIFYFSVQNKIWKKRDTIECLQYLITANTISTKASMTKKCTLLRNCHFSWLQFIGNMIQKQKEFLNCYTKTNCLISMNILHPQYGYRFFTYASISISWCWQLSGN